MKKFALLLIALFLVVGMSGAALAQVEYKITLYDLSGPVQEVVPLAKFDFGIGFGDYIEPVEGENGEYYWNVEAEADGWIVLLPANIEPVDPDESLLFINGITTKSLYWLVIDWK